MANIVVLDGHTMNPGDLDWTPLINLGHTSIFLHTPPDKVVERSESAEILVVNKIRLDATVLNQLPELKFICISATGYDNVDIEYCNSKGIIVSNAVGYSTDAVAQHVFALLFEITNAVGIHAESVRAGRWSQQKDFSYHLSPLHEVKDKTLGILGFGSIGKRVATIGAALGMPVIAHHKHPERDATAGVQFVSLEKLFYKSDILSLHVPLNDTTANIVNGEQLKKMKPESILINTGRGGLVDENALAEALTHHTIKAAALDVLSQEPPAKEHPLTGLDNCIITPHIAWATVESRQRLMNITVKNTASYLKGVPQNVVKK